jgi:lipopolysaccharide cholinephosphotransferase
LDINHGVYIDIFPLDGYPADAAEQKRFQFRKMLYKRQLSSAFKLPPTLKGKITVSMFRLLGYHKRSAKVAAKLEKLLSQYPVKGSSVVCNHGTWYGSRDFISAEFYGKGTDILCEGMTVRVPEQYEAYLAALYGDWRTPPPPEKQKGHHYYEICDTEKSYIEHLKHKKR